MMFGFRLNSEAQLINSCKADGKLQWQVTEILLKNGKRIKTILMVTIFNFSNCF